MDLPSEDMYDIFKDEIWKGLGPVDPDWFEILTAQMPVSKSNVSDPDDVCAYQEGHFKTPLDKAATDSQLFSTPKAFRRCQIVSSETEDEQSFTVPQEKVTLPWMVTQSPFLFPDSKVGVQTVKSGSVQSQNDNSFDLLNTPKPSPVSYAKQISESLGAQINPDMSWTSSLNTPPALPSTLILSKANESPSPASVTTERNVMFVRKLFPSLSKESTVQEARNKDVPAVSQGDVNREARANPQFSLNQSEGIWQQKVPDTNEDGELQSTEAGVPDGAENVPPMYFANSSSALRKVKPDRIKRRQIILTEEFQCSSKNVTATQNTAFSKEVTPDVEPGEFPPSPPAQTGDTAISQWSPLNLSEVPPCVTENNISTEKKQDIQIARPSVKIPESGFIKKRRKFVYSVEALKPKGQGEVPPSQKMNSSSRIPETGHDVDVQQFVKAPDEADRYRTGKSAVKKQLRLHGENLLQSPEGKVQDLDMSQLCRVFAQDFSQMSDSGDQIEVAEDIQHDFSPSTCLSAMKQAKKNTRQVDLNHNEGSSRGKPTNQKASICKHNISDSGFQSVVSNITHITTPSYGLTSSENTGQCQEWSAFKAGSHVTTPSSSTLKGNEKVYLDAGEESRSMSGQRLDKKQTQDLGEKSESHSQSASTQQTSSTEEEDTIYSAPLNGPIHQSLSEKVPVSPFCGDASGFRTASNKGIRISSANLERAKHLFMEAEADRDQSTKRDCVAKYPIGMSNRSVKSTTCDAEQRPCFRKTLVSQLTASQRADVTELCTFLEEADSQCEFTQFKTAKLKQHRQYKSNTPQKTGKKIDPDFFAGIDFDESFNSDADDHPIVNNMPDKIILDVSHQGNIGISNATSQSTDASSSTALHQNSSLPPDFKHIAKNEKCPNDLHRAEHSEAPELDKSSSLMLDVAFKTARENVLRVSKKCLNKARFLFADLDASPRKESVNEQNSESEKKCNTDSNVCIKDVKFPIKKDRHVGGNIQNIESVSSNKQATSSGRVDAESFRNSKTNRAICQTGFHMASGKQISISAKYMQQADAFFQHCDEMDCDDDTSLKKDIKHVSRNVESKKSISKFNNLQSKTPEGQVRRFTKVENAEQVAQHTNEPRVDETKISSNCVPALRNASSLHRNPLSSLQHAASKYIDSSVADEWSTDGGFCTASGKKVSVSADAMKKAEFLLDEICTPVDFNREPNEKEKMSRAAQVLPPKKSAFQTASAKPVSISETALEKATLFQECEEEDKTRVLAPCSKVQLTGPRGMNSGFFAASGKPVSFSSEALKKAKALFSDMSSDIPAVSDTMSRVTKHGGAQDNMKNMDCGFKTASGAAVHVSQKNLLKAKHLFKELDDLGSTKETQEAGVFFKGCDEEGGNAMLAGVWKTKVPLREDDSEKKNLAQLKTGTVSEEHENKCTEDPNKLEKQKESGLPSQNSGFRTANGKAGNVEEKSGPVALQSNLAARPFRGEEFHSVSKKPVALSSEALQEGKPVFSDISFSEAVPDASHARNGSKNGEAAEQRHFGFTTAGGANVHVSQNSLLKAKHFFQDVDVSDPANMVPIPFPGYSEEPGNGSSRDKIRQVIQADAFPQQSGGFQTASGKAVAVSSEALNRAKTMLYECEETENETGVSLPHIKNRATDSYLKSCGFSAASGKPVKFSSEALKKAKALFSDISLQTEKSPDSDTIGRDKQAPQNNTEKIQSGRGTVHVSEESHFTSSRDLCEPKDVQTARNEEIPAERETSSVKPFPCLQESKQINKPVASLAVKNSGLFNDNTLANVFLHPNNKVNERSEVDLNLQWLNLTGCTETQQNFLAQEALDCTKALLEDESLAGQSILMTSEKKSLQDEQEVSNRSSDEKNTTRKRIIEDADMTGQPPLKKRLLEEFDITVDDPKISVLHPVKSCPNGLMKDRGVFKYSVSLQPNVTKPSRDGKSFVDIKFQKTTPSEGSATRDGRSAPSKTPFVPPFIKNMKQIAQKIPVPKENPKTPVFIPPFKKQKTIPLEKSSQQEEAEKDKQIEKCKSNTPVLPPKTPQGTTDDASNSSTVNGVHQAASSHIEEAFSTIQDFHPNLQNIELARDMQVMRIRKKKRQTIRPLPGSLFLTKTSGLMRIPLKVAVGGKPPVKCTIEHLYEYGVQRRVSEVRSETAESFRFNLRLFIRQDTLLDEGGVQLADGGWLIPCNDWTVGKEEFYRALCDTPGVDPKLISEAWVYNHYRWIVWKQASMEKSFPETMGSFCLTPEQVLLQLKYRYDVEVDHSRRPALRKIMEKDDTAAKTIVLCVGAIVSRGQSPNKQNCNRKTPQTTDARVETPSAVVWLTDGWYAIKAQLDEPLTAMLRKGLLTVGGKLIINGAQLVGSQDACSPLEAPELLMLKICANSCRRARWNAKLGFYRDPRPFLLPLYSLYSNGGPVGCVDIVILRSYPIQWMEKKPDGSVVFRSTRAEEKEARQYSNHKQKAMEMLFAKIQAEFEKEEKGNMKPQRRKQVSLQSIGSLQDGEELYEAIGEDAAYFEAHLSEQQLETFHSYRRSLMEKKHAEMQDRYRRAVEAEDNEMNCPKRDVVPVWRINVADSLAQPSSVYQLNLWRPSLDLQSLLKEGSRYKVYNLIASDGKKRSTTNSIQLTGTKRTQFQDLQASEDWLSTRFQPRVSLSLVNLQNTEFQPVCGEVDLSGYVISVIDGQGSSPAFYLADEKLNFVKVRCFNSLSQTGLEDTVKPFVLLALSNLQLRGQSIHPTPVVYAGDLTVFSTNPKEVHLQESLSHIKTLVKSQENFFQNALEKLSDLVKSDGLSSIASAAQLPQTPASTRDRRQDSKVTHQKPIRNLGSFTPANKNPPAGTSSTEKDPIKLKRRRALDYLSRIPSPPPLSLLGSLASPCVNKTFNPPRRSGTPSTLKTAPTSIKKSPDSLLEDEWVNDEELAMIDTQVLHGDDLK